MMTQASRHIPLVAVLAINTLWCASANAADFYRWVDANGSTHYTQEVPNAKTGKKVLKKVSVDTFQPSSVYNNTQAKAATTTANASAETAYGKTAANAAVAPKTADQTPSLAPSASSTPANAALPAK